MQMWKVNKTHKKQRNKDLITNCFSEVADGNVVGCSSINVKLDNNKCVLKQLNVDVVCRNKTKQTDTHCPSLSSTLAFSNLH